MSRILLVEDDDKLRATVLFQLRSEGFAAEALRSAEEAWGRLSNGAEPPDLLLLDVRLPGISGVELLRRLLAAAPGRPLPPTVIVSGEASMAETVEALRLGVHDFVEKPVSRERLLQSVRNALEHAALRRQVAELESRLEAPPEILGESPAIERLREAIGRAAATDARVLVVGESGTGKELVAGALHRLSSRRQAPLVKVNCAAIPAPLVEAELFGHARGAYTDAKAARAGLFEEAHGGTVFLDEIGDMPLELQGRLLRVLEDGVVRRVGETRDRQVDVRVIAATHRDLEAEVAAGRFRQDLFFRLAHLPLPVPALRERGDDVRLLFQHFLDRFAQRHRLRKKGVEPAVFALLRRHRWPGNVRELRNLCERLTVFGGDPITADQLPSSFFAPPPQDEGGEVPSALLRLDELRTVIPWRELKAATEREYLEWVLRRCGWNFAAAARLLGLQRPHLHEKAATLGIVRPPRDGSLPDA